MTASKVKNTFILHYFEFGLTLMAGNSIFLLENMRKILRFSAL